MGSGQTRIGILDAALNPYSNSNPLITSEPYFTTIIDEPDSSTIYIGEASPGAATSSALWRIKKVLTVSTSTLVLWADGNVNQDNVWDNRASLSYS